MFTLRCALIFVALCTLIEVVILILILNGYAKELEPILGLVLDADDIELIREAGRLARELSSLSDHNHNNNNGDNNNNNNEYFVSTPPTVVEDSLSDEAQLALNEKFASAVMSFDYETARDMLKYSRVDVNFHDGGKGHLLFRLCSTGKGKKNGKELPEMLKMVELLLEQPNVDVNSDETSWPPLKGAVANRNVQCATMLLRHPDIVPQVTIKGLTCDLVPHILPEIALVMPRHDTADECFSRHRRTLYDGDDAVRKGIEYRKRVAERIKGGKNAKSSAANTNNNNNNKAASPSPSPPSSSSSASPRGGSGSVPTPAETKRQQQVAAAAAEAERKRKQQQHQQQQQQSNQKPKRWNYVMDPAAFDSLWSATFFFVTGGIEWERCRDYVKVWGLIVGAHFLVVGSSAALFLSTMKQQERQHQEQPQQQQQAEANAADAPAAVAAPEAQEQEEQQQPGQTVPEVEMNAAEKAEREADVARAAFEKAAAAAATASEPAGQNRNDDDDDAQLHYNRGGPVLGEAQ